MAGYQRTIWNGDAGKVWTNRTDKPWYQLLCNWSNTCGLCAQYDRAVADASWPIPFHFGCNCRQAAVPVGANAEPAVDFRETIRTLPPDQRSACVGSSNLKLIEAGVVSWDDVVTRYRVRDLNEVVAIKGLDVGTLLKHGVRKPVAEKAFATVNTPAHQLVAAKRSQLLSNLRNAGLSQPQVSNLVATGLSRRLVVENGPSGRQEFGSRGSKPEQVFRLALASWAPTPPSALDAAKVSTRRDDVEPITIEVLGDVPASDRREAEAALATLSEDVRRDLARGRARIKLASRMSDALPEEVLNERPRGWPPDATLHNTDGLRRGGDVIATSYYVDYHTKTEKKSDRVAGNLLHESGHAIDAMYGRPSRTKSFAASYEADAAGLSVDAKAKLDYYLLPAGVGREEVWAELTARLHGFATGAEDLLDAFPKTAAWMRRFFERPRSVPKSSHVETKT